MPYYDHFRSTREVVDKIDKALREKTKLSLIRVGDGENRALSWNTPFELKESNSWFPYAGIQRKDVNKLDLLVSGIRNADICGLEHRRGIEFRELTEKVIRYYKINPNFVCRRDINMDLYKKGILFKLLKGKKVVIIGRKAASVAKKIRAVQVEVADFMGFEGFDDIYRVEIELGYSGEFDAVLVAAGIPAIHLCPVIAEKFNTVALDIGHTIDYIVSDKFRHLPERQSWLKKQPMIDNQVLGRYVVQCKETQECFVLSHGIKRRISSPEIMEQYGLHAVKEASHEFLQRIPDGDEL